MVLDAFSDDKLFLNHMYLCALAGIGTKIVSLFDGYTCALGLNLHLSKAN